MVVTALTLVGSEESGGVLDKAVPTYKTECAGFANNAAAMSAHMSTPVIEDYKPSGLEESASGAASASASAAASQVIRLDPATLQPIGEVPAPPSAIEDAGTGLAGPTGALSTEPTASARSW